MSMSDNAELGVKLLARQDGDTFAGVPIKKRRFHWVQSPSPPRSCSTCLPADNCDVPVNEPSCLEPQSSGLDAGDQMFNSKDADLKDSSWQLRTEPLADGNVNLALNCSPGFNQGFMFMFGTDAKTGVNNGEDPTLENRSALRPIVGKSEFRSMLKEPELSLGGGSAGKKLVLSEKSAFQRVLGNNESPLASRTQSGLSMDTQNSVGSYIEQEKLDPCSLDLALGEGQYVQSRSRDTESSFCTANVFVQRTHWDLNTAMDSWEGSSCSASLSCQVGSKDSLDLRDMHYTNDETRSVGMAHQESGINVKQVKHEIDDSDCHLKLSNSCTFPCKQSDTETGLSLQVKTASGSSHFDLGLSSAPAQLISCKEVSALSLSVEPMPPSYNLNLAVANAVKPEPFEEGNVKDTPNVNLRNFEVVENRIVKFEPCEGSIQEGLTAKSLHNVNSACRLEQAEVPSQADLRTAQYSEPGSQIVKLPIICGVHQVEKNVSGALNLISADGTTAHHHKEMSLVVGTPSITDESESVVEAGSKIMESVVRLGDKISELPVEPGSRISELPVEPGSRISGLPVEPGSNISELPVELGGKVSEPAVGSGSKISELVIKLGSTYSELNGESDSKFSESVDEPGSKFSESVCEPSSKSAESVGGSDRKISESVVEPCSKILESVVEPCSKISESLVEPLVPDCSKLDYIQVIPITTDVSKIASEGTNKSANVVSESVVPDVNNSPNGRGMPIGANIPESVDGLVSEPMIVEDSKVHSIKETDEMVDKVSVLLLEATFSGSEEQKVSNALPEIGANLFTSDGHALKFKSSRFLSVDESHIDPYGTSGVAITNEKGEASETYEHKYKPDGSHYVVGDIETVPKQRGIGDDYEDGEVRDLQMQGVLEGSCEETKVTHLCVNEAADSGVAVAVPVTLPSHLDGHESTVQNLDGSKDVYCTLESGLSCSVNVDAGLNKQTAWESQAIEKPSRTGKKKLHKIIRKVPEDLLGKEKGLDKKPTSSKTLDAGCAKVADNIKSNSVIEQVKGRGTSPLPGDHNVISKRESLVSLDATKSVGSRCEQSRIIHLNSSSNTPSSSGRMKSNSSSSISPRIERERLKDESFRGVKPRLRSIRDEGHDDGFHKSQEDRNHGQRPGKPGPDFKLVHGRIGQQLYPSHDPDNRYPSENLKSTTNFPFCRPKNVPESASTVAMDGFFGSVGRTARKRVDDEPENFPQSRRLSSGGRERLVQVGVEVFHRAMRDLSPGRCTGGVPDPRIFTHDEKLKRGLVDDLVEPSLFAHPGPRYEPRESRLIRRERRSLSPPQRKGGPHFPLICLTSPRAHSPGLWMPSRRSPDGFEGPHNLTGCRSPPPVHRVQRMRSPHQRTCFPEDMMGRRCASPPYVPQLCDEMRDIGPLRDHDLRPSRHLQRNFQRFDLVDHRFDADEYFERLHARQSYELQQDNEHADVRGSNERRGLVRSFRHRYKVGNVDESVEEFHHHMEDIPQRPTRFCPEPDGQFPDRATPRDRGIRNRLGNVQRRPRVMEEQEDDYDVGQGWRDTGFKDDRVKRRRF